MWHGLYMVSFLLKTRKLFTGSIKKRHYVNWFSLKFHRAVKHFEIFNCSIILSVFFLSEFYPAKFWPCYRLRMYKVRGKSGVEIGVDSRRKPIRFHKSGLLLASLAFKKPIRSKLLISTPVNYSLKKCTRFHFKQ